MKDINKLLDKKYELLTEVLSLCKNVKYGKDMEENILEFTKLYDNREPIFEKLKVIDEIILEETGNSDDIIDERIKAISKEILTFDKDYIKNEDEFKTFLNKKIKEVNTSKKINQKFNKINYEMYSNFNIQG